MFQELSIFSIIILVDMYDEGKDITTLASMVKLKGGRLARQVTDECLQFWGGMGYTSEVGNGALTLGLLAYYSSVEAR